jgi:putative FmdB family regulatory protein
MPTYAWKCTVCGSEWDVVTTVSARDEPEECLCGASGVRGLTVPAIDKTAAGDWNNVSYNPGLGCWTKSYKHGRDIAKARGLEEIGNEAPDKIHAKMDSEREKKRETRWRDADRQMVYD